MRSLLLLGLFLVALGSFVGSTCCANVPRGWKEQWPRTDFSERSVPLGEITSGGPPKDGIPSVDRPRLESIADLGTPPFPHEPVMSVEIGGDARAYPLSILVWHEIVNDTVGGVPVAVTYCPLCNSGVVFRRVVGGEATTFGTTGKFRQSDLVMYDRGTESWWQQFDGRAIVGERTGEELERVPSRMESLGEFHDRHPDGLILVPNDPAYREDGRNPYLGYDASAVPFLYRGDYDGPGSPLMRVVAVPGRDEAWSFDFLQEVLKVEVGDLVIRWSPGQASALDAGRVKDARDVGTVTVQRRLPGGGLEDVPFSVPFAFAFQAFNADAPIRHLE